MPDEANDWSAGEFGTETPGDAETHELEGTFPAFAETDLKLRKHG